MNKKIVYLLIMLIPVVGIVGTVLYLLTGEATGKAKIVLLLSFIPILNIICAILLILDAFNVIKL